jgi:glucokinase
VRLLVFDVGGSHVAGAICRDRALVARRSVPVDSNGSEEQFYCAIDALTSSILHEADMRFDAFDGMCFAFPGPFDYKSGVSLLQHKFVSLYGLSVRNALAVRLGMDPEAISFVNDADAFLLGELSIMPESRKGNTIGVTLGTGVGSAFAVDGLIVRSGKGVPPAGEIWNLPWRGGIMEDVISTRGIQALYEGRTRREIPVKDIAERCPDDPDAVAAFAEFGATLGDVLKRISRDFVPNLIILGGAISRSADLFLAAAEARFANAPIQISTLFEEAALIGAAAHWKRKRKLNREE